MWKYFLLNLLTRVVCTSFMRWSGTTLWSDILLSDLCTLYFFNSCSIFTDRCSVLVILGNSFLIKHWEIEKCDKTEQIRASLTKLVQNVCKNIEQNSNQSEPTETPEYIELNKIINNFLFSPSIFPTRTSHSPNPSRDEEFSCGFRSSELCEKTTFLFSSRRD